MDSSVLQQQPYSKLVVLKRNMSYRLKLKEVQTSASDNIIYIQITKRRNPAIPEMHNV